MWTLIYLLSWFVFLGVASVWGRRPQGDRLR